MAIHDLPRLLRAFIMVVICPIPPMNSSVWASTVLQVVTYVSIASFLTNHVCWMCAVNE